jgi:hypothetical protein
MTIERKLRLDDRFSWSFLGAILGLVGVVFAVTTLYLGFRENRPDIVYEIENQSDVFDLHRPLRDLSLSFRGQDVQQQNLNLRILTVRLWNRGGKDILQGQYDQTDAWGISINPGQVIEVRIGENNSQYLASRINPRIVGENTITLDKVILEHEKFVTLDVLVLHHKDTPPKITALGKIAGIEQISVLDSSAQRGKPNFWNRVWSGTLLIHAVRFLISLVLTIVLLFIAIGITEAMDAFRRILRRKRVKALADTSELHPKALQILEESYIRNGIASLKEVNQVLTKREDALGSRVRHYQQHLTKRQESADRAETADERRRIKENEDTLALFRKHDPLFRLFESGLISLTADQKPLVNNKVTETLNELLKKLK